MAMRRPAVASTNQGDSLVAITESEISTLVDAFYARVREDATIGPIFESLVKDWPSHLLLLKKFWSTVLRTTGAYRGDPMATHLKLPLEKEHFERWLALFGKTATDLLSPHNAVLVTRKSEQIAKDFQLAIAHKRGQPSVLHVYDDHNEAPHVGTPFRSLTGIRCSIA